MRRRAFIAVVGSATAGGCIGASGPNRAQLDVSEASLLLNWKPNGLHVPYYAASGEGFYEEQGLDLAAIESGQGSDVSAKQVGAGNVRFAVTSSDQLVNVNSRGLSPRSVAVVMQKSPVVIFTVREQFGETFSDVGQLAGETVGSGPGMVRILTRLVLERSGVRDDVELVDTGYDTVQQLLAGKIDAAGGVFGDAIAAEHQGATVDSVRIAESVPSYGHVLATSRSFAADHASTVEAFLRATAHGAAWAQQHPDAAIDHLVDAVPALAESRAIERDKWKTLASGFMTSAAVQEHGWGWSRAEPWRTTYRALRDADLLGGAIDVGSVWTNDHLDTDYRYIGSYDDVVDGD